MAETVLIDAASVLTTAACDVEAYDCDEQEVTFRVECSQVHAVAFYAADDDFSAITAAALLPEYSQSSIAATTGTDGNLYVVDTGSKTYVACVVTNSSGSTATVTVAASVPTESTSVLFSVSDARAFDKGQLADATDFSATSIQDKEAEIREWLERVCGVNFVSTTHTAELHDGDGSDYLMLKWPMVSSVTAISVDGDDLTATQISTTDYSDGLAIDEDKGIITRRSGVFDAGWRNVSVTYVAGFTSVPDLIKRAALMICVSELPASNVPFGADDYDAGGMSVSFGRGDGYSGNWHRIPEVVKAIRLYSYKTPGIC